MRREEHPPHSAFATVVHLMTSFFVTDLHEAVIRYEKLFLVIRAERPRHVFVGGDLLAFETTHGDFLNEFFVPALRQLRSNLGEGGYPAFFIILGNDDPVIHADKLVQAERDGLCHYVHKKCQNAGPFPVYGLSFVPPTPFRLKDWERYDVSRYVDPGCISPEEGAFSVPVPSNEIKWKSIQSELAALASGDPLENAIFLFHSPPYNTPLDRAALDGKKVDGVEVDPHIGSIAIRRFIEERQPLLTLHGHAHESARLTGCWRTQIGRTVCINAAHDGPELALVRFDPHHPANATRELI